MIRASVSVELCAVSELEASPTVGSLDSLSFKIGHFLYVCLLVY